MNATAHIGAEIGGEQIGRNRVLRIRHDRKCYRGQHRLDQPDIVLAKALGMIGREREANPAVRERL